MNRLKKERELYAMKLNGALAHQNLKYESVSPSAMESGNLIPRVELESEREVFETEATPVLSRR